MADSESTKSGQRLYGIAHLPAPTGSEATAFDREAIEGVGVPQATLMENAGRSAALVVDRLYPDGPVLGVVGAGNNGGDALVALRTLGAWGRSVSALVVAGGEDRGLEHGWPIPYRQPPEHPTVEDLATTFAGAAVIVDGLLGTGIRGAPREPQATVIGAMNSASAPVLSLDLPSGVDADTGRVQGAVVHADVTVAFGWPKLGTLIPPGLDHAGRVLSAEIGFPPLPPGAFGQAVITPAWADRVRPRRAGETHKYEAGVLLLVAGRPGMAGAAVMAARAAQRAGLGLLRVASFPENREVLQSTAPEAIFVDATSQEELAAAASGSSALAVGPGLGTDERAAEIVERVLRAEGDAPAVLDADALTLAGSGRAPSLSDASRRRPVVLTPHTGELERITEFGRAEVAADRVAVARAVARDLGAVLLLKGIPSVVCSPDGPAMIDVVGTADLATGGMGDVLTGVIGSFIAQGAEPSEAAPLGLYYTGRAAVLAQRGAGLIPDDVIARLPDALAESPPRQSELPFGFVTFDRGS